MSFKNSVITSQNQLKTACKDLTRHGFITIDTEFLREKTYYPKLCLVQIGDPEGHAFAIDPIAHDLDLSPLYEVLFDSNVIKVFHAARQDLEIFYNLCGRVVKPFFDTQIAAMVCGYGDSVGYENLVRNITGHQLDKSAQFTDWSKRPLSDKQLRYALDDVVHLVEIYNYLSEELEKRGRTSWVHEEEEVLADPASYANNPEEAWERIKIRSPRPKNLAVLRAIAAWREERAQKKDLPRAWVLRDETLADMASQLPKDSRQLSRIRNMPPDQAKGPLGETLLELIAGTLASDKKTWPRPPAHKNISASAHAMIDMMKLLLKTQCMKQGVAAKLVAAKDDIERIVTEDSPDIPALKGWRYDIFGRYALELKKGDLAIGMKDDSIAMYKISQDTKTY